MFIKPQTILINQTPTVIRPMGDDYVVGDDPKKADVDYAIKCWPGKDVPDLWPNPPIAAYFRKVMAAYGSSAITAWQGRNLVGFLPFMPLNCGLPEMVFCVCAPTHTQPALEKINAAEPIPFEQLSPKVLKAQCASVNWRLYRQGIGSAMARYLVTWARVQGWERIEGWAFAQPDVDDAYIWIPSIQFWEKAGFEAGGVPHFAADDPNVNKPAVAFAIDLQTA